MTAKALLAQCLAPIPWPSVHVGRRIARLWAFARLSATLRARPDPSIVIEGAPEVHGTGEVTLGKELYLYRELFLETRGAGRITIGDRCVVSRGVHIVAHHAVSIGAGSMIDASGLLLTCAHVFMSKEPGSTKRSIQVFLKPDKVIGDFQREGELSPDEGPVQA